MNDIVIIQESPEATQRAFDVQAQLHDVRAALDDKFFTLCDLLREAHNNAYYHYWGYTSFETWIEYSGLDLSPRQAYYYIGIAGKAEKLGLDRADLAAAKISKLKEIFTLDPAEHGKEMKELVAAAATEGLQVISDKVQEIRTKSGKPNLGFWTLRVSTEIKPIVNRALNIARHNYGSIVTPDGQLKQASDSQCLEVMAADYALGNIPNGYNLEDFD